MDPARLRKILEDVRRGRVSTREALESLARLPFETVGPALVDHHRSLRQHLPEVILCEGKTVPQCVAIARAIVRRSGRCLATRATRDQAEALVEEFGKGAAVGVRDDESRPSCGKRRDDRQVLARRNRRQRLLAHAARRPHRLPVSCGRRSWHRCRGGLVGVPLIAVPTSVGYGASYGGLAALLAMLNACAAGVTVVNIDNGFGAGYAAGVIARQSRARRRA